MLMLNDSSNKKSRGSVSFTSHGKPLLSMRSQYSGCNNKRLIRQWIITETSGINWKQRERVAVSSIPARYSDKEDIVRVTLCCRVTVWKICLKYGIDGQTDTKSQTIFTANVLEFFLVGCFFLLQILLWWSNKYGWVGHITRMGETRNAYKILVRKL
jgi:hypothetical protein